MTEVIKRDSSVGDFSSEPFLQPDAIGVFPPSNVSVQMQPPLRFTPEMATHLRRHWQETGRPFSGRRATWTFTRPPVEVAGELSLAVAPGRFRDVNATRDSEVRKRFPEEVRRIDPVAATIVPVTTDGLLVVGADEGGPIKILGGYPEVSGDVTRILKSRDLVEGKWSPLMTAKREVFEEIGIIPDEIDDSYATGVAHVSHPKANVYVVTHAANASLSAAEISGRPNGGEFGIVGFLPDDPDAIADLLAHYYASPKAAKIALLLRGLTSYREVL